MSNPTLYPDGSSLSSTALAVADINRVLQPITMSLIGLVANPTSSAVRLTWPPVGAPWQETDEDVTYVTCTPKDDPYDKIRDRFNIQGNTSTSGWGQGAYGTGSPYGGGGGT